MPVILLERLPLPNLSTYVTFSVGLLACAVTFSYMEVSNEFELQANNNTATEHGVDLTDLERPSWDVYLVHMFSILVTETWCIWATINMVYCCLILVGKTIQNIVFGELRVSEREHLRDRFWNFVFYKFIFIFGVMNVQSMDDVLMWCAWFSLLGFLQFLAQLCKDRFEYLSFSPTTSRWTHIRVVSLLSAILLISTSLLGVSLVVGMKTGWHTSAFMVAECFLLILSTLFVIVKYSFHLYELQYEGIWEKKAVQVYYTELTYDMMRLTVDFMHHLHMLIWGSIFLSMANLVICMQLRYLFYECRRRIHRHKNYLRIVHTMERLYPTVRGEEIGDNDTCAICWDTLTMARKLPCGHLFHNSCLRSWLEQDSTCPTCRCTLSDPAQETSRDHVEEGGGGGGDAEEHAPTPDQTARTINHFFQFDGSRYVSWFPSFSVEVTHTRLNHGQVHGARTDASHLSQLAREVQSVFPHIPLSTLQEDLQITLSVDQTIDNVLEGRLQTPPTSMYPSLTQSAPGLPAPTELQSRPLLRPLPVDEGGGRSFLQDDNLANLGAESETSSDNSEEVAAPAVVHPSFQFSKNPAEREQMLAKRKKDLMDAVRSRFLAAAQIESETDHDSAPSTSTGNVVTNADDDVTWQPSTNNCNIGTNADDDVTWETADDVTSPRELAYQAAVRRRKVLPETDGI